VLRNEFGNLSAEADELELVPQQLKVDCVFHPDLRCCPLGRSQKRAFEARERTLTGVVSNCRFSVISSHVDTRDCLPTWNLWPSKTTSSIDIVL
jgi:hypothetical protein